MKQTLLLFVFLFSFAVLFAQPKAVKSAYPSVASVVTYRNGVLKADGSALFVSATGELIASGRLFAGADSAVVIDNNGKVHTVKNIIGIDNTFDCVKVCIASGKKIKHLAPSVANVNVGDELYMLTYGVKKNVLVEPFRVKAVDSVYSLPYYTFDRPVQQRTLAFPVVNGKGEFVALMQPSSARDTIQSYAVGASLSSTLVSSTTHYGRGYYPGMGIRTALPQAKEDALSCMYMQAMMGDSLSWISAINDFMEQYPQSFEGYQSFAEYAAICNGDMERAQKAWEKAYSLADNKADVCFGKAKVIYEIVQGGDTLSHPMLSFSNALDEIDKAISIEPRPLYISYKADMLYGKQRFADAAECYESLASTDMRSPDLFAKASQCHVLMNNLDKAVELLDSATSFFEKGSKHAAPYIFTRAVVKSSAKRYREAVLDMNVYEELMGGVLNPEFYYMREQAELNCKMFQQALNDIETAIDLATDNVLYLFEKGMLCYRVRLTDEGIRTMQRCCELAPEYADSYYLLGRLYMQKGDAENARQKLETAEKLGHPDARTQINNL